MSPTTPTPSSMVMLQTWTGPAWRGNTEEWVLARLAERGIRPTGPIEQPRVRPWSTQLTVPTDHGRFWFKENCPALAFEASLITEMARIVPDRVLPPLAIHARRGQFLSPDGGATVSELGTDTVAFPQILQEYAELQRSLVDHEVALKATGLEVLEPGDTVDHIDRVMQGLGRLPGSHPLHADSSLLERAELYRPVIAEAADRLAEVEVPNTLQHNDLHQENTFAPDAGLLRFFDFGDAVWSHPFCSLYITVQKLARSWACEVKDPRIARMVDTYLDHWTDFAPLPALRRLVDPALVIGKWHRYNSWHRLLPHFPPDHVAERDGYLSAVMETQQP